MLVRVRLAAGDRPRRLRHVEEWAVRTRFLNVGGLPFARGRAARRAVRWRVVPDARGLRAHEERTGRRAFRPVLLWAGRLAGEELPQTFGPDVTLRLDQLAGAPAETRTTGGPEPVLRLVSDVALEAGETRELWFRFGLDDGSRVPDPAALFRANAAALGRRLPRASAARAPQAAREVPWHAALLAGGACRDHVVGGHTLNQGSAYAFTLGFNGAARDPLQHALPLVYSEPDLALSVLRNTCAWATPDGDLPYSLDGAKRPYPFVFEPSDQNLYALWLAAEYAAATGDLAAFDAPLAYHPAHRAAPAPLREHLRRQFRFLADGVGRGVRGHVRMRNLDWNDLVVEASGVERAVMVAEGESVLNSAVAAWVLPVFAGLCARLGEADLEAEARALAESLRQAVAAAWNGRWFDRAYVAGTTVVGADDLWLEVQPWAVLCGAATPDQARALLRTIDSGPREGSPLGARVRWPVPERGAALGARGENTGGGGVWFCVNAALVWAAARLDPDLAWDEWRRMTLAAHARHHPGVWEGTVSGPDSYNAPEAARPGRTFADWVLGGMQVWPVANLHSHSAPLLGYLRLLGVEPTATGALRVGAGAGWRSPTLRVEADGHGELATRGPVVVETSHGTVRGGPGRVRW